MRFIAGWYRDPPDDETEAMGQGERVELVLPLYQAAEFVLGWHGSVWDFNIEGFYSTDDYRTGRESMDTLFVQDGPGVDSLHVLVELLGAS